LHFCSFRGKCKRTLDEKDCENPKPKEVITIVEVIFALARLADALQGAVVLQICSGKNGSSVMLPELKKNMISLGILIIIFIGESLHISHDRCINPHVFHTKGLHQ